MHFANGEVVHLKGKRILSFLLLFLFVLSLLPAAAMAAGDKPVITEQPADVTAAVGTTASFTVTATGIDLQYQWYLRTAGTTTWKKISASTPSATTDTLRITAAASKNGNSYRCVVKNTAGSVTSEAATLTVLSVPAITSDPHDAVTAAGRTAVFTVEATGGGLAYQWYVKTPAGDWTALSSDSAATATLEIEAASTDNGNSYRCEVTNAVGTAVSGVATLTISPLGENETDPLPFTP